MHLWALAYICEDKLAPMSTTEVLSPERKTAVTRRAEQNPSKSFRFEAFRSNRFKFTTHLLVRLEYALPNQTHCYSLS